MTNGKWLLSFAAILLVALVFRISVAHWLPNDAPDDGRVYEQIARNVLEQHVYSHDTEPPYAPSLIRLPGYPLFLTAIYSIFGHGNNGAVRIVQALIDTASCALIALLAFLWQPDEPKKLTSAFAALLLAAVCPFTTIYAATVLTEVPTMFLVMAMFVAVTLAFRTLTTEDTDKSRKTKLRTAISWWCVAGLLGGLAVLMRPDAGLFLAAVGLTLIVTNIWGAVARGARHRFGSASANYQEHPKRRRRPGKIGTRPAHFKFSVARVLLAATIFSMAFAFVLMPWTIRNWRVFHVFQPLSPAHAEMPGEFVPRGYMLWARTWIDEDSYVAPFLWALDSEELDVDDLPPSAFDSAEEKNRVSALFDKYNHLDDYDAAPEEPMQTKPNAKPTPSPENEESEEDSGDEESDNSQEPSSVEITPQIDAGFEQIARERIARHPFRYYVWLPIKRVRTMWFDTHSQYWPFEGALLPLDDLDYENHQQIWLPLFAALTALYTLFGMAGGWVLWRARSLEVRTWLLLVALAIILRLGLFASLENPEPRYLVEFFPFLSVLGGMFLGGLRLRRRTNEAKN